VCEQLEQRQMLDAVAWTGAAGDNLWHTAANWSGGAVPTAADEVTIDVAGSPVINVTGDAVVQRLVSRDNLQIDAGQFSVLSSAAFENAGVVLVGGGLQGGAWTFLGSGSLLSAYGTISDLTLNGNAYVGNNSQLIVAGDLVLNGTLTVSSGNAFSDRSRLYFAGGEQTLSGAGQIVLQGPPDKAFMELGRTADGTLTVAAGMVIRGKGNISQGHTSTLVNYGQVIADQPLANQGVLFIGLSSFVNHGVLRATNGSLLPAYGGFVNPPDGVLLADAGGDLSLYADLRLAGTLRADGGTIRIGTNWTLEGPVSFQGSGGAFVLIGTGELNGGTLDLSGQGNALMLEGTTRNGTINLGAAGAHGRGGTISALTLNGNVYVGNNSHLVVAGDLELNGTIAVSSGNAFSDRSHLYFAGGNQALAGTGEIVLQGAADKTFMELGYSADCVLTVGADIVIHGKGNVAQTHTSTLMNRGQVIADQPLANQGVLSVGLASFINHGTLRATNGALLTAVWGVVNPADGALVADGAGNLSLQADLSLAGTVRSDGGTIHIGNNWTLAGPVSFQGSGGAFVLTGTGELNGGTLDLTAQGNPLMLEGTTRNGTINLGPAGAHGRGGTISGLTLNGNVYVGNNSQLIVAGDLVLNGALTVSSGNAFSDRSHLYFAGGEQTLSGAGQIVLQGPPDKAFMELGRTADGTLTVAAGMVIRGKGNISQGHTSTLVNYGQVIADQPLANQGVLSISLSSFVNRGTVMVTAGNCVVSGGGMTNHGMVSAVGGALWMSFDTMSNEATGTLFAGANRSLEVTCSTIHHAGTIRVLVGGTVRLNGALVVESPGVLRCLYGGELIVNGSLLGEAGDADRFQMPGSLVMSGGALGSPRQLELMSSDRGPSDAGFARNFAYSRLSLGTNSFVRLIDAVNNLPDNPADALYVDLLSIPAGSRLDLNGQTVYARIIRNDGTIANGVVQQVPDSGTLFLDTPTVGSIDVAGELDEWEFWGLAGRGVSVVGTPGAALGRVRVELLDPDGAVLRAGSSPSTGAAVRFDDVALPAGGLYRLRVRADSTVAGNTGSYSLDVRDTTQDRRLLVVGQPTLGYIDSPFNVDRWSFSIASGRQVRFDLINAQATGLTFTLEGPNGVLLFQGLSSDSPLLNTPYSGEYALIARTTSGDTGGYSFRVEEITQRPLSPGGEYSGVLAGSSDAQLFAVHVPDGDGYPMFMRLDDGADEDRTELYVSFGSLPTRADHELRSTGPASDQSILIPHAHSGTWYVLVYGAHVPAPSQFTLRAGVSSLFIERVSPDRQGTGGILEMTLFGAGFLPGVRVSLVGDDGVEHESSDTSVDLYAQAHATISLAGLAVGQYSVRVTSASGGSDELRAAFAVTEAGQPHLETRLILPNPFGRPSLQTIYVEYANTGQSPMIAPLLRLQSSDPDDSDKPILTLDEALAPSGVGARVLPEGFGHSVLILGSGAVAGVLNPGERMTVPVYAAGLLQPFDRTDRLVEMEIRIFDSANAEPIPWEELREELRPYTMTPEAWDPVFANLLADTGTTWGHYVQMLGDNARYLGRLGKRVVDVAELYSFEVIQAIGINPIRTLASAVDAAVATPGDDLVFNRVYALALDQRFSTSVFGRGWSAPWLTRLVAESDGSVNIFGAGGNRRRFEPDHRTDGAYRSLYNDSGTLRWLGSEYEITEQNGSTVRFSSGGRLLWSQDSNANRVTLQYDGSRLVRLAHSAGAFLNIEYNAAGLVTAITDSVNRRTTFAYDESGQYLVAVTAPDGQVTAYTYETVPGTPRQHALTSVTAAGTTRFFQFDSQGRLASTFRTGNAEQVNFAYDAGRVTATESAGGSTSLFYDEAGRVGRIVDPFGQLTTAEYGADGRLSRLVDPLGQSQSFTWCGCGSLTSVTNQLGNTTRFSYEYVGPNDTIRRMTSFTDANGNVTRYAYDTSGNLTATTYPNESVERVGSYDHVGNPLSFINRRGQTLGYQYNADGRITRQTFADGTSIDFAYDTRGNLTSVAEPDRGITTFQYDVGERLTRVEYPEGRSLVFGYDELGRRISMTDHEGFAVNYAYDALGRLHRLTDGAGVLFVEYAYDVAGRLSRKDNGNNTYTLYAYDPAGQVLSIVNHAPNGGVNSRFDYTYDALGGRTSMVTIDGSWSYSYDATGQLTRAVFVPSNGSSIPPQDLQYVYDPLGNRIRTIENGVTTEYTTNDLNQYTRVGGDTLMYDADGNLISRAGSSASASYTYDQQGRLTRVVTSEGVWHYQYDSFGSRIASTARGDRTEYLLDPLGLIDVVGEYSSTGLLVARYAYGLGLVARMDGARAQRTFYEFDAIGSTSSLTDTAGVAINHYAYLPFGTSLYRSGLSPNSFEYVGEFGVGSESNGLTFMRARVGSADIGRFISVDPIGIRSGDVNWYRYVGNAPTVSVDPSGLLMGFIPGDKLLRWPPITNPTERARLREAERRAWEYGAIILDVCSDARSLINGEAPEGLVGQIVERVLRRTRPGLFVGELEAAEWGGGSSGAARSSNGGGGGGGAQNCDSPPPGGPAGPGGGADGGSGGSAVIEAIDPNHLYGPSGQGPQNFLTPDSLFPYRIEFENYGPGSVNEDGTPAPAERWASAPAQRVEILNDLPDLLDWSTFELTQFGWGDTILAVPSGSQHYQTTVNMTYNGRTFEVWFEAGLDVSTGRLSIVFQSVDPATGLPPDVLTGFLPPEDGTGRGKGFLSYIVRPVTGLGTGTEIRNIALITFDRGLSIATNQVDPLNPMLGTDPNKEALVTIDAAGPASRVLTLPSRVPTGGFVVRWSGDDDSALGSGIESFDVYVSTDGGDFLPWLTGTTASEAVFTGELGRTYSFYSIARDHVGFVEAAPSTPDVVTAVGAFTIAWDGDAADNNWFNPLNWTGNRLPTSSDDVEINVPGNAAIMVASGAASIRSLFSLEPLVLSAGGTLTLAQGSVLDAGLTIGGGTLQGAGTLSVSGVSLWTSGVIALGGLTFLESSTLTITGAGAKRIMGSATVFVLGEATWDDGVLELFGGSLVVGSSGTFVVDASRSALTLAGLGGTNRVLNAGTLRKAGALVFDATGSTTLETVGRLVVDQGELRWAGMSYLAASVTVGGSGTLRLAGSSELAPGSVVSGPGSLVLDAGSNDVHAQIRELSTLAVNGSADFTGGLAGIGQIAIAGHATFARDVEATALTITAAGSARIDAHAVVHTLAANQGTLTIGQRGHLDARTDFSTSGMLEMEVWSVEPGRYGRLSALGTGTIGGTLRVTYVGAPQPRRGRIDLISATTLAGSFTTITTSSPVGNEKFVVQPATGAIRLLVTSISDLNNDGRISSADFFQFLDQFFTTGSDFNHDGVSNSQDFFDFLVVFFRG
jgi:RHS repeat-associated protein